MVIGQCLEHHTEHQIKLNQIESPTSISLPDKLPNELQDELQDELSTEELDTVLKSWTQLTMVDMKTDGDR